MAQEAYAAKMHSVAQAWFELTAGTLLLPGVPQPGFMDRQTFPKQTRVPKISEEHNPLPQLLQRLEDAKRNTLAGMETHIQSLGGKLDALIKRPEGSEFPSMEMLDTAMSVFEQCWGQGMVKEAAELDPLEGYTVQQLQQEVLSWRSLHPQDVAAVRMRMKTAAGRNEAASKLHTQIDSGKQHTTVVAAAGQEMAAAAADSVLDVAEASGQLPGTGSAAASKLQQPAPSQDGVVDAAAATAHLDSQAGVEGEDAVTALTSQQQPAVQAAGAHAAASVDRQQHGATAPAPQERPSDRQQVQLGTEEL